jgi:hypothetical protein
MKQETFLKTTVNIEENLLTELKQMCKQKGVTMTALIKQSVKVYLDHMDKNEFQWHTISYQEDGPVYKKFHITLKPYEYDTYSDARKVTRLSFSYIVAIALRQYAFRILNDDLGDTYPLQAYTKYCIVDDNYTYFVFSWGISRNSVEITVPPVFEIDPEEK